MIDRSVLPPPSAIHVRPSDGAEFSGVEVVGPAAKEYLAYASLAFDTSFALECLDRLERQPAPAAGESDGVRLALWTAFVVTYGRCFRKGSREHYAVTIAPRYRQLRRTHQWLIEHRNQTVAHLDPDSDSEFGTVYALVRPSADPAVFEDVTHYSVRNVMPDTTGITDVRRLVRYIDMKARQRRDATRDKLTSAAKGVPARKVTRALRVESPIYLGPLPPSVEEERARTAGSTDGSDGRRNPGGSAPSR